MKTSKMLSLFLAVLFIGCASNNFIKQTSFLSLEKVILKEEGPEQFLYWEIENAKSLWATELGSVAALVAYQDSLSRALGPDQFKQAVAKEETQALPKTIIATAENGDRKNALLVHSGSLGKIRKINFLEAQVLNYQMERYPMFSQPTEFHGFIATHEEQQKLRVYFGASDTEWPPHPDALIEQLEKDRKQGWTLTYHLHNHYCKQDKDYIGILAPSLADAQYFKMLAERFQVKKTLITNGFHTVELEPREFYKFAAHGDGDH